MYSIIQKKGMEVLFSKSKDDLRSQLKLDRLTLELNALRTKKQDVEADLRLKQERAKEIDRINNLKRKELNEKEEKLNEKEKLLREKGALLQKKESKLSEDIPA